MCALAFTLYSAWLLTRIALDCWVTSSRSELSKKRAFALIAMKAGKPKLAVLSDLCQLAAFTANLLFTLVFGNSVAAHLIEDSYLVRGLASGLGVLVVLLSAKGFRVITLATAAYLPVFIITAALIGKLEPSGENQYTARSILLLQANTATNVLPLFFQVRDNLAKELQTWKPTLKIFIISIVLAAFAFGFINRIVPDTLFTATSLSLIASVSAAGALKAADTTWLSLTGSNRKCGSVLLVAVGTLSVFV